MVDALQAVLEGEAAYRREHDDWVERERMAVTAEANAWALAHDWPTVTVADVEKVEPRAMGHVDYMRKLALYVAELVWRDPDPHPVSPIQ